MRILLSLTMMSLPSFKTKGIRKYIQKYPGGDLLFGLCLYRIAEGLLIYKTLTNQLELLSFVTDICHSYIITEHIESN